MYIIDKNHLNTHLSDITSSNSVIDHFFMSTQLDNGVNQFCIINDIENQSD